MLRAFNLSLLRTLVQEKTIKAQKYTECINGEDQLVVNDIEEIFVKISKDRTDATIDYA